MSKKKIIARYKQLRTLITRAKEDAELWGTNKKPLILQGIKETSAHDYTVYDDAYNKFVKQRMKAMPSSELNEAKEEEKDKKKRSRDSSSTLQPTRVEIQLARIADALERLADILENDNK